MVGLVCWCAGVLVEGLLVPGSPLLHPTASLARPWPHQNKFIVVWPGWRTVVGRLGSAPPLGPDTWPPLPPLPPPPPAAARPVTSLVRQPAAGHHHTVSHSW